MKFFFIVLVAILTVNTEFINSQYAFDWMRSVHNGDLTFESHMALDPLGNIYRTGYIYVGPGTNYDFMTVKYDSRGNQLWMSTYNGPNTTIDKAKSIAVSQSGNVYITGLSYGESTDYATIKYNSSGVELWAVRYKGTGGQQDEPTSIAVDNAENVYVTGYSVGAGTGYDIVTIKYNSAGDSQWVARYDSASFTEYSYSVSINSFGNLVIAGVGRNINNNFDFLTLSYTPSGNLRWSSRYNGPGNGEEEIPHLVCDRSGNSYIGGASRGSNSFDFAVIKYNDAGMSQWISRFHSSGANNDHINSIKLDKSDNVFVTGTSFGFNFPSRFTTIKYNTLGTQQWIKQYEVAQFRPNEAYDIALDTLGNSYVCGYSNATGTTYNGENSVIIKYNQNGVQQYLTTIDEPQNTINRATSICVTPSGNKIYVSGIHKPGGIYYNYTAGYSYPMIDLNLTTVTQGLYSPESNVLNMKDTIRVYLRNISSPYQVIDSSQGIVDTINFTGSFNFVNASSGVYYIVSKHRSCIETWSKSGGEELTLGNFETYDFTSAINQAFGNNLILRGNRYCIFSGDIDQNGLIDLTDITLIFNDMQIFATGYLQTDINGDGYTDITDLIIVYNNSMDFVGVIRP